MLVVCFHPAEWWWWYFVSLHYSPEGLIMIHIVICWQYLSYQSSLQPTVTPSILLVHPLSKHASKPFNAPPRYSYSGTLVQVQAPFELNPHIEKVEIVYTCALFALINRCCLADNKISDSPMLLTHMHCFFLERSQVFSSFSSSRIDFERQISVSV